ncbi:MAG TPA: hypothetical protein VE226_04205 [Nitrososphaeraceae archaeon]|nr:hypothetical protein [Nitrososphaeraceae archaeon]
MGRSSYRTLLSLAIILLSIVLGSININNDNNSFLNAYGHTFSPNESASFLSFVDQIQVESELVQTNLANDSTSLAQEHAKKARSLLTSNITTEIAEENQRVANELTRAINDLQDISLSPQQVGSIDQLVSDIDSILGEAESTRIEQEDLENATIQALAFADLVNSILENYGNAYAVDFDMTNMSNMVMNGQSNNNMSTMTMSNMDTNGNDNDSNKEMNSMNMSSSSTVVGMDVGGGEGSESGINSSSSLVNLTDYQSAQALAAKALEIFNTELRPIAPNNSSALLTNLENGLPKLNDSIRNKASPMDIMMIVHTQIHPNILQAFNLRLE